MHVRKNTDRLRVLVLEPYYGGSHRSFLKTLMRLPMEFSLMDMPARKWKWRMRLAAPHFANELRRSCESFDRVLCSTFVDVAALRALGPKWLREVPVLTYFHENQFAYPVQVDDKRDMHFALTNLTTAMASDSLAFNSRYNLDTFLHGIDKMLSYAPDMKMEDPRPDIKNKSIILPPPIDFSAMDSAPVSSADQPPEHNRSKHDRPVVLWNHRWEHDKNPEEFFNALYTLDSHGLNSHGLNSHGLDNNKLDSRGLPDFGLIVMGESFSRWPDVFAEAAERLAHRTIHFGYAPSRAEYAGLLRQGTIAVSTAQHEFFGMAMLEAVRAGARPLLPERLAYPELFPQEYLYGEGDLTTRLHQEIIANRPLGHAEAIGLTKPYSWETLHAQYHNWITSAEKT